VLVTLGPLFMTHWWHGAHEFSIRTFPRFSPFHPRANYSYGTRLSFYPITMLPAMWVAIIPVLAIISYSK